MESHKNYRNDKTKSVNLKTYSKSASMVIDLENNSQEDLKTSTSLNTDSNFYSFDMIRNDNLLELPTNTPAYDKEKEIDYSCISYLTSKRKPDIYVGAEVMTAKQYRVKQNNQEQEIETKTLHEDDSSISSTEEKNKDYENLKRKDVRYFTVSNITIRCYNCNEVGHISRNCPNELEITCFRCQQKGHLEYDCPNIKCFKCNKIGHKSYECKVKSKDIVKCENCNNIGHEAVDCLIDPPKIKSKILKAQKCYFCTEVGHLMCRFKKNCFVIEDYYSDDVNITESEDDGYDSEENFDSIVTKAKKQKLDKSEPKEKLLTKKKRNRIFNKLDNKDIMSTVFCPKCAEMHSKDDCNVQLRFNSFDSRRQLYSKTLFRNNREDESRHTSNANKSHTSKYSK